MTARVSLINCFAAALLTLSCNTSGAADDLALPEQFNEIKQTVLDTVSQSQRVGAATTYHLLNDNLAAFRALSARVQQAPHMDDVIEELATELDNIAGNFEKAAKLRVKYSENTVDSRALMAAKHRETQEAISELNSRIQLAQTETQRAQNAIASTNLQRDKNRIIVSSNQSVLNSLDAQKQIWERFADSQSRLMSTFAVSTERVDFVLFVLQKNAQVYREAANTAQLRRNVRLALQDLQSLGAIENSLVDLAASWREVDAIVSEIGREEFVPYAGS